MTRSLFSILFGFILITLGMSAYAGQPKPAKVKVKTGDKAPDFSLRDLKSNLIRLSDIAYPGKEVSWKKKKKVLIDFFQTDCEPCKKELPQVVAYHNKFKDKVQVMMIALLESEDGKAKLDKFLKDNKIPFPVLIDEYESAAKKYIVDGETVTLPSIFLIDENGIVRARFIGLKEDLETSLQKAVSLKPCKKK
jgi:peroxiredoxin